MNQLRRSLADTTTGVATWERSSSLCGSLKQQPEAECQEEECRCGAHGAHRNALDHSLAKQHGWYVGDQHANRRSEGDGDHIVEAGAKGDGGNLRLVADFDQEEG